MTRRYIIRLDCSNAIGNGHLTRMKNLVLFFKNHNFCFVIKSTIRPALPNNCTSILIPDDANYDDEFEHWPEKFDHVILDIPHQATRNNIEQFDKLLLQVKEQATITLVDGIKSDSIYTKLNKAEHIDHLVVPSPVNFERFNVKGNTKLFTGIKHHLFEPLLYEYRNNESYEYRNNESTTNNDILITMGGSDPFNITIELLKAMSEIPQLHIMKISFVLGPYFSLNHSSELKEFSLPQNWHLIIKPCSLASLIHESNLVVSAPGTTRYEACFLNKAVAVISPNEQFTQINNEFNFLNTSEFLGECGKDTFETMSHNLYNFSTNSNKIKDCVNNCKSIFDLNCDILEYEKTYLGLV